MTTKRLEGFSDGVLAIIITIMVLELKPPHEPGLAALQPLIPKFWAYLLSFVYVAIYWNNHHHLLHVVKRVTGAVLWANMHLLFWLSLIPFTTAWMGENHGYPIPALFYGVNLFLAGVSYFLLTRAFLISEGRDSEFGLALGRDHKGKASMLLYLVGTVATFVSPMLSQVIYALVAAMWLVPDKRFEVSEPNTSSEPESPE